jgi:MFS family permease
VRSKTGVVLALGVAQTLAWASSYYLPAILVVPMARDTGVSQPHHLRRLLGGLAGPALLGPHAGRAVDRHGGRPVLLGSNVLFALGLAALGLAQGSAGLFAAWVMLGLAMGSGLYETAFAALVRLYGRDSRSSITGITLLAGFASTVGWPLSTVLEAEIGWRGACFTVGRAAPVARRSAERDAAEGAGPRTARRQAAPDTPPPDDLDGSAMKTTVLLSYAFAATWFVSTAMAAHLPGILQAGGASLAVARGRSVPSSDRPRWPVACSSSASCGTSSRAVGPARRRAASVGAAICWCWEPGQRRLRRAARRRQRHPDPLPRGRCRWSTSDRSATAIGRGFLTVPTRFAQALAPWLFGLCLARWGAGR